MAGDSVCETARVCLRLWRDEDAESFAVLNSDPEVMRHFPARLDRAESDALLARIRAHHEQHGFGLWALQIKGGAPFVGFVGLSVPRFEAHFLPGVEIGWRILASHWGKGYVTEAARAALGHGFEVLKLHEIVSFTVEGNVRSWRVMQRLGMHRDPADDFDMPTLPEGHLLRRHLLYRMSAADWQASPAAKLSA